MIYAIEKDGKSYTSVISYGMVKGYVYGEPLLFIVGIQERLDGKSPISFKYEEEVTLHMLDGTTCKATYSYVDPRTIVMESSATNFVFLPKEMHKLRSNQYKVDEDVKGVKLKGYVNGCNTQGRSWHLNLRKVGQIPVVSKDWEISTVQFSAGGGEGKVDSVVNVRSLTNKAMHVNYISTDGNSDETHTEQKATDYPRYSPYLKKSEVKAMKGYLIPKMVIEGSTSNSGVRLGNKVKLYNDEFIVMEYVCLHKSGLFLTMFVLGQSNEKKGK